MRLSALIICAMFVLPSGQLFADEVASPTQTVSAHDVAIGELLDLTGIMEAANTAATESVERLRSDNPTVPVEVWASYTQRVTDRSAMVSLFSPIYTRHLAEGDVEALIAFYHSDAGSQLRIVRPALQQEARAAAEQWAGEMAAELEEGSSPVRRDGESAFETERIRAVHQLLRDSGTLAEAREDILNRLEQSRAKFSSDALPASFWDHVRSQVADDGALLRLWTPAYLRHFSESQIRALLDFYHSPVGARYVAALPEIRKESLEAATQLAHQAARGAVREVLGPLPQWRMQHPQGAPGQPTSRP